MPQPCRRSRTPASSDQGDCYGGVRPLLPRTGYYLFMKRLLALAVAVVLVVPASAGAAAPSPSIGPANSVTSTSAVLNGAVNPNGEATTYHFEYGTTKAYGTATPEQGPTAANKAKVNVSASVG